MGLGNWIGGLFGYGSGGGVPSSPLADRILSDAFAPPVGRTPGDLDRDNSESPEMRRAYWRLYREEPAVRAAVRNKVHGVACLDMSVVGEDEDDPRDSAFADFVAATIEKSDRGPEGLIADMLTPAIVGGWSLGEITLEETLTRKWGTRWGLKHVRSLDTDQLRLQVDVYRNVTGVWNTVRGLQVYDPSKTLLFTYNSLFSNPFGQSDLRAVYRDAGLLSDAYQVWYLAIKLFGEPMLHGKVKNPSHREMMEAALESARGRGLITSGPEDDVQILNMAGAAGYAAFKEFAQSMRENIFLAVHGAYLPFLEGQGGNDAHGDTQASKDVGSEPDKMMLAKAAGRVLTKQLVPRLRDPNADLFAGASCQIKLGGASWEETGKQIDVAVKVMEKTPVSKKWFLKIGQCQPPEPNDPDDAIGGPPPQPPGGGPPGMPGQIPGQPPDTPPDVPPQPAAMAATPAQPATFSDAAPRWSADDIAAAVSDLLGELDPKAKPPATGANSSRTSS